jgi:NAD(P)-dependent dehydrogenase (short-subunit alcohol dehydrogenase family)/uncharacterized protein YndB with AHSA1/START domain
LARNRIHIEADPEAVFAVLSEPLRYPDWVVGAAAIRDQDEDFPAPGSRFHHEVGLRPFAVSDETRVVESQAPRRIVLTAKARPLGTARIEIDLSADAGGTEVAMDERPDDRLTSLLASNPVADTLLRLRNAEALARLKRLVEGRPVGGPRAHRELRGQRVLITGGSSGIGLATAELLTASGARVVLLARNEIGLERARLRLVEGGAEAYTVSADVCDRAALGAAVEEAVGRLGGLDVLVTSAASAAFGPFVETAPEDFDATVATVLGGAVDTIRAALPHLDRSRGAIVAVGSIAARMPLPELSAYTAAKHGLAGFLETLRVELAEARSPVTVSLVNPGAVDTPLWDHLQSQTGLLPPAPPELYSPQSVAEAVTAVIRRPRRELTVGGAARAQIAFYSNLTGATEGALKLLARLALGSGDRPAGAGALHSGQGRGEADGGFGGRPSLAGKALQVWDAARRSVGTG